MPRPRHLAATLSGGGLDAYEWLAAVCGAALEVVKCRTQPLEVPAEADIVLEGYLDPAAATVSVTLAATAGPVLSRADFGPSCFRSKRSPSAPAACCRSLWPGMSCRRVGRAAQGERTLAAAAGQSRDSPNWSTTRCRSAAETTDLPFGHSQDDSAGSPAGGQCLVGRGGAGGREICRRRRRRGRRARSGRSLAAHRLPTSIRAAMFLCATAPPRRPITPLTSRRSAARWESTPRANCRASGRVPRRAPLTATREVAELVDRRWQEYGIAAKINTNRVCTLLCRGREL